LDYLTTHTSLSPIWRGFAPGFVNDKKGCTHLAAASDKVYQWLACGRWFSPGTPASSTTKTGRHDIAESGVKHKKSNKKIIIFSIHFFNVFFSDLGYDRYKFIVQVVIGEQKGEGVK